MKAASQHPRQDLANKATPARPSVRVIEVREGACGSVHRLPAAALITSAAIDLLALGILSMGGSRPLLTLTALVFHIVAAGPLLMSDGLEGSRRMLAIYLVLCLPVVGAPLVLLALGTKGGAGLTDVKPGEDADLLPPDPEHIRRIAEALPACEALMASGSEDRQTIFAGLIGRKDADAVELLRWLALGRQELAVEAALALEELSVGFESELERHRARVSAGPSPSAFAALQAGTCISEAIESGIVDPAMLGSLASEARRYFELCRSLDPTGKYEVLAVWARMEIAALRPEAAFALLDRALALTGEEDLRGDLMALREEARFASHGLLSYELCLDPASAMEVGPRSSEVNLGLC